MPCSLASTSSNVQDRRSEFWRHLQPGGGHAAGVRRLAGAEHHAVLHAGSRWPPWWWACSRPPPRSITPLATSCFASSMSNSFCVAHGSAMSHRHAPHAAAVVVVHAFALRLAYSLMRPRSTSLICFTSVQVDARRVVDPAGGVGQGDHLGAELLGLLGGVDGHVAGAGHGHGLAREVVAVAAQHTPARSRPGRSPSPACGPASRRRTGPCR